MDFSTLLSLAPGILAAALRMATPIALAAYAGILAERAGVVNIAIEGMMLMAAMVGDLVMLYTGNIWVGVVAGVLAAGLLALLHAVLEHHVQDRPDHQRHGDQHPVGRYHRFCLPALPGDADLVAAVAQHAAAH